MEKLHDELLQQTRRAEKAESDHAESEKKLAESIEQYSVSESRASGYQGKYRQSQKTLLEWQNKCQELEEELDQLRAEKAAQPEPAPAAPAPAVDPEPAAPAVVPEPVPQPQPQPESPSIEARKILADARIYAENAERRMRQEAEEQKKRMAENAKDLAAGVMVLRERLNRVDEKLSAAALDLENATAAIYAALDHTDADLESLGVKLNDFAEGTPRAICPSCRRKNRNRNRSRRLPAPPPTPPEVPTAPAGMFRTAERLRPAAAPAAAPRCTPGPSRGKKQAHAAAQAPAPHHT